VYHWNLGSSIAAVCGRFGAASENMIRSHYRYLGIVFSENGSIKIAVNTLANQASTALFLLMRGASKLSLGYSIL
jgi:hypothetical protein